MKSHPYNSSALSSHSNSNFNSISSDNSSSYSSNYGNTNTGSYNQSITLRTVSNEEVRFEYSHSQQRVLAYFTKENENEAKQIKVEDMPIEFSQIKDASTLALFLDGAYVKASTLSNGEIKLYVEQKGLGGGKGDRDLPSWNKLLNGIREKQYNEAAAQSNNNNNSKVVQKKVFISYAWEDGSTEEGRIENAKLQRYIENLRNDLQKAGMSVFYDIGDMHGDMKVRMEENLRASDAIITINTPRFKSRAEAVPQTNLGFEYQLTLEKAKDIPYGILPLHYSGNFNEAFPDALKSYLIRDCRDQDKYSDSLVATQRPLGIIPAIYGIDCDDDLGYRKLVQNWQYEKLSRLPEANPDFVGRELLLEQIASSFTQGASEKVINQKQTINGLGGIGKTQLALAYSHKYGDNYTIKRWLNTEGAGIRLEFE